MAHEIERKEDLKISRPQLSKALKSDFGKTSPGNESDVASANHRNAQMTLHWKVRIESRKNSDFFYESCLFENFFEKKGLTRSCGAGYQIDSRHGDMPEPSAIGVTDVHCRFQLAKSTIPIIRPGNGFARA
ncbi:hypothetical protein [Roseibium sp. RKSG952]|uniref:hypothetical protein n=1 Tax=Roseibium sp. RKSG952 TaxID=2529384 RepID=UPI001FCC2C85|nr:hypothetical protein [Roseibium sp. RKSG952]